MTPHDQNSDYTTLIQDIKSDINTRLRDLMSGLFDKADKSLFDMTSRAGNSKDQVRYFELMRLLKEKKSDITVDYLGNIRPLLRPYPVTEAEKTRHKIDSEGELSLVDRAEMEDMVLVKSVGERAAGKFREQISHLEARLEHMALKSEDIFQKHAISPANLCQAFDDALGQDFDIPNKKILFGFFYDEVASRLDSLYDAINDRLIDAGILPEIKIAMLGKHRQKRRPRMQIDPGHAASEDKDSASHYSSRGNHGPGGAGAGHDTAQTTGGPGHGGYSSGHGETVPAGAGPAGNYGDSSAAMHSGGQQASETHLADADVDTPQATGGYAMTAAPGRFYQGGGQQSTQNQGPGPDQGYTPASPGGPAQGSMPAPAMGETGIPAPASYSHYVAGMPAEQVSQTLEQFLGAPVQKPADDMAGENPVFPPSTPHAFGHEEILSALTEVQAQPQFHQPGELRFDAEAIKNAVVNEIAKRSGGIVTKRINQLAAKTIDFIELIFDAIIDDEDISDTIKALLLRLQIPIIKASMLDPEFFIYDTHPARILLDKIAEVGFGVSDHQDETYIELDKVISIILNEYELQTSTFQHALDKLYEYIEKQEAIAREKEEIAQKQVLREHARNTVLKALRTITAGKTLPESIHPLVLKRWPTLMFNHYLVQGKDNEEWVTIIEVLREIVASVQPITTADELAYLINHRESLLQRARDFLQTTNHSSYDIESVLQGLEQAHENIIARTHFDTDEIEAANERVAEESYTELPREAESEPAPEPAHAPKLPANIMPGMWFHIFIGEDKAPRRAKLSVIIIEDSKLVFVNHSGDIIVEKEFSEFSKEIEEGRSKMIMGHSVFDHALSSVIGQLRPV